MNASLSPNIIEQLTGLSSCAVANAIERLGLRLRNVGFSDSTIRCRFPRLKPTVGFAVTLRLHGSNPPMEGGVYLERTDWWDDLKAISAPRIVVIEDADRHPGIAAFIGETHAAILQAMGCVGVVTNGAVRDLDPVERLGLQLFSGTVSVSHAYAHVAKADSPVHVGGLEVVPGDLLHGDQHGIVKIPIHLADEVVQIAGRLRTREKKILRFCQSAEFSPDRLRELLLEAD
jgi:4-hydroxy-4-methyl-2-oxoglutarate aldolase